jgi:rod shape-determining protein MreD
MKFLFFPLRLLPALSVLWCIVEGSALHIGPLPLLPSFCLIPVYYWSIFRPQDLPLWSLLGLGLFYDSLLGNTLGVSSALLLWGWGASVYIRPFLISYNFVVIWGGFGVYSLGYIFLYMLFQGGGYYLLGSWVCGILLYPLCAWVLSYFHFRLRAYG